MAGNYCVAAFFCIEKVLKKSFSDLDFVLNIIGVCGFFIHVGKKSYLCIRKNNSVMPTLNIIKPPKISVDAKKSFWKQIVMIVVGTTISLVLTISAATLMEKRQRVKDRKLSAMMVLSNIEMFSRTLDEQEKELGSIDSVAAWLLSKPVEELEQLPNEVLDAKVEQVVTFFLTYDKSAESIFSNNIETWKNMGNVQFIDQVGKCFSVMHSIEEYWNKWTTNVNEATTDISDHPGNYEGGTWAVKCLRCEKTRRYIQNIHTLKGWFSYTAATMRYQNRRNMKAIGIEEQELMDYTDAREMSEEIGEAAPNPQVYYTAPIDPANLTSMNDLDVMLDSIMGR